MKLDKLRSRRMQRLIIVAYIRHCQCLANQRWLPLVYIEKHLQHWGEEYFFQQPFQTIFVDSTFFSSEIKNQVGGQFVCRSPSFKCTTPERCAKILQTKSLGQVPFDLDVFLVCLWCERWLKTRLGMRHSKKDIRFRPKVQHPGSESWPWESQILTLEKHRIFSRSQSISDLFGELETILWFHICQASFYFRGGVSVILSSKKKMADFSIVFRSIKMRLQGHLMYWCEDENFFSSTASKPSLVFRPNKCGQLLKKT